ncbi:MAG: hypothetical protein ABIJ46_01345 [bacterium]
MPRHKEDEMDHDKRRTKRIRSTILTVILTSVLVVSIVCIHWHRSTTDTYVTETVELLDGHVVELLLEDGSHCAAAPPDRLVTRLLQSGDNGLTAMTEYRRDDPNQNGWESLCPDRQRATVTLDQWRQIIRTAGYHRRLAEYRRGLDGRPTTDQP